MCSYSQHTIVDFASRLGRIVQQSHNCSRLRRLIVKEILRKIEGKGKKREQRLPKADKMVTRMIKIKSLAGDYSRGFAH